MILRAAAQTPPHIVIQPHDEYACAGSDVIFSVHVTGDPPMEFYWFKNGTPILDGVVSTPTNSFLTVTNVQLSDDGTNFYVFVNNPYGGANSSNAFLYVSDPPQISQQPSNQVVPLGGTITFSINAHPAPLNYSWWFQGRQLTNDARTFGADTPNLAILNAQLTDAGYYRAVVTNSCLTLNSTLAKCDVGNPPQITNQPTSKVAPFLAFVQFS